MAHFLNEEGRWLSHVDFNYKFDTSIDFVTYYGCKLAIKKCVRNSGCCRLVSMMVCVCASARTRVCVCVCMCMCLHVCVGVRLRVCVCVCASLHVLVFYLVEQAKERVGTLCVCV